MERRSYVYKITCKITGEFYFGSSFKAKRDWYWGSGRRINERISKYGKENFVKEILGEFDDRVDAHKVENEYIEKFRHDEKCLNQMLNRHFGSFNEETCAKIGVTKRGEKNPMFGKHFSEETKQKIRESLRGRTPWNKGKKLNEEAKQKIRESNRGRTPWNKGKKLNKETGEYE